MSTELSTETADTSRSMLEIISAAAANPAVDVDKMNALLGMQERIMDRNARSEFNAAFIALQAELPSISRRGAITNNAGVIQSRFSRWEDIHRVIAPLLRKHGFALTHRFGDSAGKMTVCAVLDHSGGHSIESGHMPMPIDASGAKNNVQGVGSSFSYGKRYTSIAILNIVTHEDDDGQGGAKTGDNPNYQVLYADAEIAASKGIDAYQAFFSKLPRADKLELVNSGRHERFKRGPEEKVAPNFDTFPGDR